jgi:hypothetical protein
MFCRKALLFLVATILFLLSNSGHAGLFPLFSEGELESLKFTQEEWALELKQHQMLLDAKRDIQPYSKGQGNRLENENLGPIVSIVDPVSEGDVYRSQAPVRLLVYLKHRLAPINIDSLRVKGKHASATWWRECRLRY